VQPNAIRSKVKNQLFIDDLPRVPSKQALKT
jgi:hypothetical protein